jgi:hypothetical protein
VISSFGARDLAALAIRWWGRRRGGQGGGTLSVAFSLALFSAGVALVI